MCAVQALGIVLGQVNSVLENELKDYEFYSFFFQGRKVHAY